MSENMDINEMNQNQGKGPKLSVLSELNGTSIGVGIGLICIIIASIVFYVFMNLSPKKTLKLLQRSSRRKRTSTSLSSQQTIRARSIQIPTKTRRDLQKTSTWIMLRRFLCRTTPVSAS